MILEDDEYTEVQRTGNVPVTTVVLYKDATIRFHSANGNRPKALGKLRKGEL